MYLHQQRDWPMLETRPLMEYRPILEDLQYYFLDEVNVTSITEARRPLTGPLSQLPPTVPRRGRWNEAGLGPKEYAKYQGDERANWVANLKTCLLRQQDFFTKATKENNAAVAASFMVNEMIDKVGQPITEGKFVENCILQAASIVCPCPEKKGQFSIISLSANTVAERISDLSNNIYDQLREKAKCFHACSVSLDDSTDITDTAQLAMYVRGVDENFELMEELLRVIAMHGQTTAHEIFRQLCDVIVDAGLPWNKFF